MAGSAKIKAGIVGVGGFGAYRRNTIRACGEFDLIAAYDINDKALSACEKEDGAKPTSSYEELLDTPGLEAMFICSGADAHAQQALAAMEHGLHVFMEKPLCSTADEMHALLDMQKRTNLIVSIGHNNHEHCPISKYIRNILNNNELGTVSYFEKTTGHRGGFNIKPGDWRGKIDRNPGGMLFQCGVHSLHELMFYFGPISRVYCTMRSDVHTTETADIALCHLTFASGLIGTLNAFHVCPYRHCLSIYGTARNLYREDKYFDEGSLLYRQTFTEDGAKEPWEQLQIPDYTNSGAKENSGNVAGFAHAIRNGGASPYPSLVDGARAVAVVFAADVSAKSGVPVDIPDLAI